MEEISIPLDLTGQCEGLVRKVGRHVLDDKNVFCRTEVRTRRIIVAHPFMFLSFKSVLAIFVFSVILNYFRGVLMSELCCS